jgi:hypothetical protein
VKIRGPVDGKILMEIEKKHDCNVVFERNG